MNISSDTANAIEKAHYWNQQGMYFSKMKTIKGAVLLYSDIISDFFWNYAGQIRISQEDTEELVYEIITFYQKEARQPAVYLTPFSQPQDISKYLEDQGFKIEFRDAWMTYDGKTPHVKKPKELLVKEVRSNDDMEIFINIFFEAYGGATEDEPYGELPPAYGDALRRSFKNPPKENRITYYLGFINGRPVGIGTLISSNGFGGIYNIGTSPNYRRMGIGSAISIKFVEDSKREGNTTTYLMTEEGSYVEKFYQGLGFSTKFIGCGYVLSEKIKEGE